MDGVLLYPGPVSLPRLLSAVSRALQDYPHAAGRLRRTGGSFSIALTNSGISLTVGREKSQEPGKLVLRDEPHVGLVETHQVSPDFIDGKDDEGQESVEFDEPLLRIRMTTWEKTGELSMGLAWMHVLGTLVFFKFTLPSLTMLNPLCCLIVQVTH